MVVLTRLLGVILFIFSVMMFFGAILISLGFNNHIYIPVLFCSFLGFVCSFLVITS